jgi:hypothetical protein
MVTNHAVTIGARPEQIWPWLTQMGWHLGGYYTPQWVDRLMFPNNWSSLDHLDPNLVRDLKVGDTIPDGPPGTAQYVVHEVHAPPTAGTDLDLAHSARMGREVQRPHHLGLELHPHPGRRRQHPSPLTRARTDVTAMVRRVLPLHHHPGGLRHGHRDAPRPQETR